MVSKCRLTLWLLTSVTLFFAIDIVHAQNTWNVEIRPAVNFPSKVVGGLHKHVGFGLEGKTIFSFSEMVGTYIGWGWNLFPANIKADFGYEETGFTYGLQYVHSARQANPGYFVAAGGIYDHIEVERGDNHVDSYSKQRFGWQVESGAVFNIFDKFIIKPGLRYRNLQAGGLQYFSFGTGFFF